MPGFVYVWPILDDSRPLSMLITEACREVDLQCQLLGGRITGRPVWTVSGDVLVCHADAVLVDADFGGES